MLGFPRVTSSRQTWDERDRLAALERYRILDTPKENDFEDIVRLAADTFEAPIAVVNLIAEGRQWFKAEVGIGARELPLDVSICAHAILQGDTMVVPDTRLDDRFACNPLVTMADGLRFYAGALLKTEDGLPLGTLCVLDRAPRPQGITPHQRLTLEVLARLVMKQLELRRVIGLQHTHSTQLEAEIMGRQKAETARRLAADRYRSLFNSLDAGFCIVEVKFDADGTAVDYRFLETNPAFAKQTGLAEAEGKWMRELAPDHEQHWFDVYGKVARTGESVRFEHPAKALEDRWYDVQAFRVGEPDAHLVAILFNDISERRRAELRRGALLAIGDRLRSLQTVPDITSEASKMVGETLDAIRVAFGRIDASGEHVIVESDWSANGFESLAGRQRLSDLCDLPSVSADDRPIVVSDILSAATSAVSRNWLGHLGVRSFAAITIKDPDGSTSLFVVHAEKPRNWTAEDLVFIRNAGDRIAASVARREAEALQQVLNLELSHRMKNTLTVVMAIAKQTLRSVADQAPVEVFNARIQALSSAHMALLEQRWMKANIADVVNGVLGTVDDIARFDTDGPSVDLDARSALSMSLLLHELSTNALKYGALSEPAGRVAISWDIIADQLTLRWRESGGPEVTVPARTGFGSRLINMGLVGSGGVELRYLPKGFEADFKASLLQVEQHS